MNSTIDILATCVANGIEESPIALHMEHISINVERGTVTGWSTYNGPGHPLNVRAFTIAIKID